MHVIEFGPLSAARRAELEGDEIDPFEVSGLRLQFRPKDRHVALEDEHGRLIAAAGMVVAHVEADAGRFPVVGFGGVIVNAQHRGRGLARRVMEAALARARELGPDFAMLFCLPDRVGLYQRLGFTEIAGEVRVKQHVGYAPMPVPTMCRALREHAQWPDGPVVLHTLPF
jgi:predicted N-acetyltransferase YhbS